MAIIITPIIFIFQQSPPQNCLDKMRKLISILSSNVLQGARLSLERALPVQQARSVQQHEG